MKRFILIAGVLATGVMATDFASLTTEELVALRGAVAVEERDAFKTELQSRLQDLTLEERQALMSKSGAAAGTQTRTRARSRAMDALNGVTGTGTGAGAGMGAGAAGGGHGGGGHGGGRR